MDACEARWWYLYGELCVIKKNMNVKFVVLATSLVLAACGGGGGGGGGESTPAVDGPSQSLKGVFIDSRVAGLAYKTGSKSGVTNNLGEFEYNEGESVTFTLFGNDFDAVPGASVITPFDLIGKDRNPDLAINIVRLLLTVDTDGDTSTINLPETTAVLNFSQDTAAFENDQAVTQFVQENSNTALKSAEEAEQHTKQSFEDPAFEGKGKELAGTTVYSLIESTRCPNETLRATYEFGGDNTVVINETVVDEFCGVTELSETLLVTDFMSRIGNPLSCEDTSCSYGELNRSYGTGASRVTISQPAGTGYATAYTGEGSNMLTYHIAFADYRFDLSGKILDTKMTVSYCDSAVEAGYEYTFRDSDYVRVGSDYISRACEVGEPTTKVRTFADNDSSGDSTLPCAALPLCTAQELNRYDEGNDGDSRAYTAKRVHFPGSRSFRAITVKEGVTFDEISTIRK